MEYYSLSQYIGNGGGPNGNNGQPNTGNLPSNIPTPTPIINANVGTVSNMNGANIVTSQAGSISTDINNAIPYNQNMNGNTVTAVPLNLASNVAYPIAYSMSNGQSITNGSVSTQLPNGNANAQLVPQTVKQFYINSTPESSTYQASSSNNFNTKYSILNGISQNQNYKSMRSAKRRVTRACDHCRKRKIKCDDFRDPQTNRCTNCVKYKSSCTFKNWEENMKNNLSNGYTNNKNVVNDIIDSATTQESQATPDILEHESKAVRRSHKSTASNSSNSPYTNGSDTVSFKIEKLDRKVTLLFDHIAKLEWVLDKVANQMPTTLIGGEFSTSQASLDAVTVQASKVRSKDKEGIAHETESQRICTTSLLTMPKLKWMFKVLYKNNDNNQDVTNEVIEPMRNMLSISLKWHVLNTKKLMDYCSPVNTSRDSRLYDLPSKEQAKRLLENFRATALSSITNLIGLNECLEIADKYYDPNHGKENMTYSELLILNICICSGTSVTQLMKTSDYHLRKDKYDPTREELKVIESNTLLNSIYYCNKLKIMSEGIRTIQGLLILSGYLQINVSIEVSIASLETAIRYAIDMGLNEKSFYDNLSLDEIMSSISLWWRCYSKDKSFSLILSRPPIIRSEDMNMFTSASYLDVIKELLIKRGSDGDADVAAKLNNLNDALNYIINYCEYFPLFISYFLSSLVQIESQIYVECFSTNSLVFSTFDENLDSFINLRQRLIDWENNLHPCMNLKSYKQCLSILYVQTLDGNPALYFEVACFTVLRCHFHFFFLRVVLDLFARAYIIENQGLYGDSKHAVLNIYNYFSNDAKEASIKMLDLFQTFDYQPYVNDELMYYFLTGVFYLLFYVINHIDDEDTEEIVAIIFLLQSTHTHLIGENEESLVSDSMKWNTSVFFYTFLLQHVVSYMGKRNLDNTDIDLSSNNYMEMIKRITEHSTVVKNHAVDQVFHLMKGDTLTSSNILGGSNVGLDIDESAPSLDSMKFFKNESPLTGTLFKQLTVETLKKLRSDTSLSNLEIFQTLPETPIRPGDTRGITKKDTSLYILEPKGFVLSRMSFYMRSEAAKSNSEPSNEKPDGSIEKDDTLEISQNIADVKDEETSKETNTAFNDDFWRTRLFYDREFFFSEAVKDKLTSF